jgi:hypothetical protein
MASPQVYVQLSNVKHHHISNDIVGTIIYAYIKNLYVLDEDTKIYLENTIWVVYFSKLKNHL